MTYSLLADTRFKPREHKWFRIRLRCHTSHPDYQRVKTWALHYGELCLDEKAINAKEAKLKAHRKVSRAGGLGCLLGCNTVELLSH